MSSALWLLQCIIYVQLCQGIILGVMRASELTYWFQIKMEYRAWFGMLTTMGEDQMVSMAASFGHMNEQMSVDLIYAILHSITKYTIGTVKTEVEADESGSRPLTDFKLMYHQYDFTNKNVTVIDYILQKEKMDETVLDDLSYG